MFTQTRRHFMDRPHYSFEYSNPQEVYTFFSEGKNGRIKKLVKFQLVHRNLFNLSFGDWDETVDDLDDLAISDNGDMEVVLATVIRITRQFLASHPGADVYFRGSTAARTRIYRAIIGSHYKVISEDFKVLGFFGGNWMNYEKNVTYEAFLIQNRYNFIQL